MIPAAAVSKVLDHRHREIVSDVAEAYRAHEEGRTINPPSGFLRFPSDPDSRIISLPASLEYGTPVAGMKWISSFPGNVGKNRQRASAVLVLNDRETGHPLACLESGRISAARTAASAVLAAETVIGRREAGRVLVIGAGVIARTVVDFLAATGWSVGEVTVHDTVPAYAARLVEHCHSVGLAADVTPTLDDTDGYDLVVFATTATTPWCEHRFRPGQTVLGVSLRDIAVDSVLRANNIVDDVDHCLTAQTSVHLAEQHTGSRDFITGTLAQLMDGNVAVDSTKPTIFSPFGMGVLDLAVGYRVYREASEDEVVTVPDFLGDNTRWSTSAADSVPAGGVSGP